MGHERHEKHESDPGIVFADEAYRIQGAIFEVYREMGAGILEAGTRST